MNREFWITYYRCDAEVIDMRLFRTLKELSDWFDKQKQLGIHIGIIDIEEVPGRAIFDKYFKKNEAEAP